MTDQASASQVKKQPSDFVFGKVIGEGSFSTVSSNQFLLAGYR